MNQPKFLITSLLASLITLIPVIIFSLYAGINGSGIIPNGEVDNDPMRAGWAILFLSPVIYIALTLFNYIFSRILFTIDKFDIYHFELIVLIISALISLAIAYDDLKMFFIQFGVISIWLSIGVMYWHFSSISRYNTALKGAANDAVP